MTLLDVDDITVSYGPPHRLARRHADYRRGRDTVVTGPQRRRQNDPANAIAGVVPTGRALSRWTARVTGAAPEDRAARIFAGARRRNVFGA